ncbi:putative ribonuclease 3 protein [Botrytis fragariae]|uniref:Putative ribonuclease 3 protein n=1 Tax=Botrytis fragariae TaxID=1964551 RepID=A0A8H6AYN9_9HELO|nr:putative ribonuclease 3 protein [Botrytis fragariae]KAF5875932.1 putative ribonuclease 3 protein [Botrytis fragariae]
MVHASDSEANLGKPVKLEMASKRPFPFENGSGKEHKKRNIDSSSHNKISKLLGALEELLGEDDVGEVEALMGGAAFSGANELRNTLRDQVQSYLNNTSHSGSRDFKVESSSQEPVIGNPGKILTALQITPWTLSSIPSKLPPLPEVYDPTLELASFTHHGRTNGSVADLSYERLEWVGDAYIYTISTLLISQTFPALLPGKCSQLRERLVKNVTLADFARKYGFEKRAKLPEDTLHPMKEPEKVKAMGDIFEAYVAAIVLSDPKNGVSRASEWLKSLWAMVLSKEIQQEERNEDKLDSPLWRLRGNVDQVQTKTKSVLNPKEKLQKALSSKVSKLTYKDIGTAKKDKNTKLAVFTVGVFLDGWGEVDKQIGFGSANGKKEAGFKAAEMALNNKKMMAKYLEKKKIYDTQQERERIALQKQEES